MNVVYPDLDNHQLDKRYLCSRAILTPKNDSVDNINASLMDRYDLLIRNLWCACVDKFTQRIIDEVWLCTMI